MFERPGLEAVQHHLLPLEVLIDGEGRRLLVARGPIAERKSYDHKLCYTALLTRVSSQSLIERGFDKGLFNCLQVPQGWHSTQFQLKGKHLTKPL